MTTYNVLIMGASYGSLLATKLLFGGHKITMVCLPAEVEAFNNDGARVRLPIRGRKEPIELELAEIAGQARRSRPRRRQPEGLRSRRLGDAGAAIPLPRRSRIARRGGAVAGAVHVDHEHAALALSEAHRRAARPTRSNPPSPMPSVWDNFEPGHLTLCSPDPQAIRPPGEKINVLQVTLPTNFKVARFDSDKSTAMLREMEADIEAARYDPGDGPIQLPVKLKVHDSIFVPLAKWAMLLTGNYRCVTKDGAIDIKDAVHNDLEASRAVYNWVCGICERLGASPNDLVPFEKYAAAANDLVRPSSAARALNNGAPNIERTDRLVQLIGAQYGMRNAVVDQTVALVDARLATNRKAAA